MSLTTWSIQRLFQWIGVNNHHFASSAAGVPAGRWYTCRTLSELLLATIVNREFCTLISHNPPGPRISKAVDWFCPECKRLGCWCVISQAISYWGSQGARSSESSVDNSKQFEQSINYIKSLSLNCHSSWLVTVFIRLLTEKRQGREIKINK